MSGCRTKRSISSAFLRRLSTKLPTVEIVKRELLSGENEHFASKLIDETMTTLRPPQTFEWLTTAKDHLATSNNKLLLGDTARTADDGEDRETSCKYEKAFLR